MITFGRRLVGVLLLLIGFAIGGFGVLLAAQGNLGALVIALAGFGILWYGAYIAMQDVP